MQRVVKAILKVCLEFLGMGSRFMMASGLNSSKRGPQKDSTSSGTLIAFVAPEDFRSLAAASSGPSGTVWHDLEA